MKKNLSISLLAVLLFSMAAQTSFASFPDVTDQFYVKSVNWLQTNGVVKGYDDGTFRPENTVTRAEFLKMLYETIGLKGSDVKLPFKDIDPNEWYIKYLKEAYANKVINGYSDGTFRPNANISFVEAVKIITSTLFDVDKLYGEGSNTTYNCPQKFFTSSPLEGKAKDWSSKYTNVAEQLCLTDFGLSIWGMQGFDSNGAISRSDMAEMIYRAKADHDNGNVKFSNTLTPISKEEKDNFIKASKETTCLVMKSTNLTDPTLEKEAKDIFTKYGFDSNDDKVMQGLTTKYQNDADVQTAVESSVKECGSSLIPNTSAVTIKNSAFSPTPLTVKKGTKVTWTNDDSMAHTVTVDSGTGPSSGNLSNGGTYSYTFDTVGTVNYHCAIHPSMKGSVIVTE